MAGNLSDYLENALLDHFLGTSAFTSPGTVYVALLVTAATDADTGSTIIQSNKEVSGGSYTRKAAVFDSASSGATQNTSNIDFNNMPACTVVGVAVCDASSNGNILVHGTLVSNKSIDAGDILRIAAGDLDISID